MTELNSFCNYVIEWSQWTCGVRSQESVGLGIDQDFPLLLVYKYHARYSYKFLDRTTYRPSYELVHSYSYITVVFQLTSLWSSHQPSSGS